jgi:hypothetical protein
MNSPMTIDTEVDGRSEPAFEQVSSLLSVVVADRDEHGRAWLLRVLAGQAEVFCAEASQGAVALLLDVRP